MVVGRSYDTITRLLSALLDRRCGTQPGQVGQEADRTLLEFGGQTGPHLSGPYGLIREDDLTSPDEPSLQQDTGERRTHHSASSERRCRSCGSLPWWRALLSTEMVKQGDHLSESLEIEQGDGPSTRGRLRGGRVVGPAHRDGGVGAIGHAENAIRIGSPTETDNVDVLAGERMMRMGDRHPFRRWLGKRGSVLWVSQPWTTGLYRKPYE